MPYTGIKVLLGASLDMLAGEPRTAWHPVCWMGKVVDLADWAAPGRERTGPTQRVSGALVATILPGAVFFSTRIFIKAIPRPFSSLAEVALISTALAPRSLFEHARRVEDGLANGLENGREAVSHMVGREVENLDADGVVRAAVESVAENANDGVVAPLFYAMIGGAPLALSYKMVNTLDSMIGYRDEQYLYFGWIAAKLDDIISYVPARLTALSAVMLSPLVGGSPAAALKMWRRDAGLHDSPNAGVCESAYAGALGVRMGGTDAYSGLTVEKPVIARENRKAEVEDINRAANLMYASAALVCGAGILIRTAIAALRFFRRWNS